MPFVQRVVLDVLKPHVPTALELASAIAALGTDYRVKVTVSEMDEKTETLVVVIEGSDLQMDRIQGAIVDQGGSLHSVDEVEVASELPAE